MVFKMKKIFVSVILFGYIVFVGNAYALYPDKSGYTYKTTFSDIYVGLGVGSLVSSTFGVEATEYEYQGLYNPLRFLKGGSFSLNLGARFFQQTSFIRNFRFEAETQYNYQWFDVIYNQTRVNATDFPRSQLPNKGQEVLKNNFAFNFIYDIRWFSDIFYPYVGVGLGYGEFVYRTVDLKEQLNGLGENYSGEKYSPFQQLIIGFQYDTKIIKSSFYVQYKYLTAFSSVDLTPSNDGIRFAQLAEGEEAPTSPTTSQSKASYSSHIIMFGVRYYIN
jgi:hypothetical protein